MGEVRFQRIEFCNWNNSVEKRVLLCIFYCMIGEFREVQVYFFWLISENSVDSCYNPMICAALIFLCTVFIT